VAAWLKAFTTWWIYEDGRLDEEQLTPAAGACFLLLAAVNQSNGGRKEVARPPKHDALFRVDNLAAFDNTASFRTICARGYSPSCRFFRGIST
jgi:hypothetical protein